MGERVDRSEKSAEDVLLGVEPVDKILAVVGLYLAHVFHFELERLVSHNWVILEYVLQVFKGRCLRLESIAKHRLTQFLLLLDFKVNDLFLYVLRYLFRHLLESLRTSDIFFLWGLDFLDILILRSANLLRFLLITDGFYKHRVKFIFLIVVNILFR